MSVNCLEIYGLSAVERSCDRIPQTQEGASAVPDTEVVHCCYLCRCTTLAPLRVPHQWIGEDGVFNGLRTQLGLSRCKNCGLIFTNPRPAAHHLERFYGGENYSCHTTEGSSSTGKKAAALLKFISARSPQPSKTLLDVGCGSGAFMAAAQKAGWQVSGMEPGERGRESCAKLGFNVATSLESLTGKQFGVITLIHVLEHLPDPIKILSFLSSLLTSNGILIVEVPNAHSLRARLATDFVRSHTTRIDERYRAFPIHMMYYTHSTLSNVMERAGYNVKQSFTTGMGLDEYFITPPAPGNSGSLKSRPRNGRSSIRSFVRDSFLRAGLGENLIIASQPSNRFPEVHSIGKAR
jgi:SAM-dependent methyltransferase